ncbi:MAG TPA: hypothetical protein VH120_03700 [Gemmataceae bacterium]|nr:hypothetical protein [Gemmataceae bacterium]
MDPSMVTIVPADSATTRRSSSVRLPMIVVAAAVAAMSLYANSTLLLGIPIDRHHLPPFDGTNQNDIGHLGAEYNRIAVALVDGRGFADPFPARTGPTAWMPPVFSWLLAAIRWDAGGDREKITIAVVVLQDLALIATGWLVIGVARRTTSKVWLATVLFLGGLIFYFRTCFQFTHDWWVVLAALDVLLTGLVWWQPLQLSWRSAAGWGVVGGLLALTSPAVGFVWGLFAIAEARRPARRLFAANAILAAGLTVSPWVVRNYLVFGRFIPVKSNLAFELYQSQCVQEGGVLHDPIWAYHPNAGHNAALAEYARLGETAFMDRKWRQFADAVRANPTDFLNRLWNRFVEATLVYVPFSPTDEYRRPWQVWCARLVFPLPFACLIGLLCMARFDPPGRIRWVLIGTYLAYLMPYVLVSYYERYKVPLLGVEVLLLTWGAERLLIPGHRLGETEPPVVTDRSGEDKIRV